MQSSASPDSGMASQSIVAFPARPSLTSARVEPSSTPLVGATAQPLCEAATAANCDCTRTIAFWTEAQRRLASDDIDGFLELVDFPVIVNDCNLPTPRIPTETVHQHCRTVGSAAEFKRGLGRNLPPTMRKAFLAADPKQLFCNYLGSALGASHGTVAWAWPPQSPDDKTEMRITAFNLPGALVWSWR